MTDRLTGSVTLNLTNAVLPENLNLLGLVQSVNYAEGRLSLPSDKVLMKSADVSRVDCGYEKNGRMIILHTWQFHVKGLEKISQMLNYS